MSKNDEQAKNRIMKAAAEILNESNEIESITVRQIAERAQVGVGLINYHFKSKDNLISLAVSGEMANIANDFIKAGNYPGLDPVVKMKTMLKELFRYAEKHEKLMRYTVAHSILSGDMQAELFLIPALREIFREEKDEIELRIIAMQILLPLQVASVSPSAFHFYSGTDLFDERQRSRLIDTLIDNLIKKDRKEEPGIHFYQFEGK